MVKNTYMCLTILQHFKRKGYITELSVKILLLEIFERVLNTSLNILVVMKHWPDTARKVKFSIKAFFSKCDEIFSHLLKKSLMSKFIFCAVKFNWTTTNVMQTTSFCFCTKISQLEVKHYVKIVSNQLQCKLSFCIKISEISGRSFWI